MRQVIFGPIFPRAGVLLSQPILDADKFSPEAKNGPLRRIGDVSWHVSTDPGELCNFEPLVCECEDLVRVKVIFRVCFGQPKGEDGSYLEVATLPQPMNGCRPKKPLRQRSRFVPKLTRLRLGDWRL
jgi:hypothetical protein